MPTGTKQGSFTTGANCAGISSNQSLTFSGSASPAAGVVAPAALTGANSKIGTEATCILIVDDPGQTVIAAQYVAVFWSTSGGTVLNACYNATVASVSYNTPSPNQTTVTLTQSGGTGQPTSAKYYASSGSAATALPVAATAIALAIGQDVTDGISIPAGGSAPYNIQQLIATSTQPGLVEWLTSAAGLEMRLSAFLAANQSDNWPTNAGQVGSLPTGSASSNNWVTSDTVTDIRFYNLGCTIANIGVSSNSATMQAGAILT